MRLLTVVLVAARALRRNVMRTMLTMLGVIIGDHGHQRHASASRSEREAVTYYASSSSRRS